MRTKNSLFSLGLFRSAVTRFWPLWLIYFFALFIMTPMTIFGANPDDLFFAPSLLISVLWSAGIIITLIMATATATCVFSFLYIPKQTGLMASLPVTRTSLFISAFTAGLVPMIIVDVIIFLICVLAKAQTDLLAMNLLWSWLGMIILMNVIFYSFAVLCAMLTGNIIISPCVFIVLNFTVYVVELMVRSLLSMFMYGMSLSGGTALTAASPPVMLMLASPLFYPEGSFDPQISPYTWQLLLIYAAVGVVLTVAAYLIFRRRRMETSSDVVAIRCLRPVFKYCLSIGCALVLGVGLYAITFGDGYSQNAFPTVTAFMVLGAFIGYFAAEMLMKKTFRVFSAGWLGYGIVAAAIIVLMVGCRFDLFGFEKYVPEADEVQSVQVSLGGYSYSFEEPENIELATELHKNIIEHKDLHTGNDVDSAYLSISYTLTDGSAVTREYDGVCATEEQYLTEGSDILLIQSLFNTQEAIDIRKQTRVPVTERNVSYASFEYYNPDSGRYESVQLTPEQAVDLYQNCISPDIADGTLGRIWLYTDGDYRNTVYSLTINLELYDRTSNEESLVPYELAPYEYEYSRYEYFYTTLTVDAERTCAWIAQNTDIVPLTVTETDEHSGNTGVLESSEETLSAVPVITD